MKITKIEIGTRHIHTLGCSQNIYFFSIQFFFYFPQWRHCKIWQWQMNKKKLAHEHWKKNMQKHCHSLTQQFNEIFRCDLMTESSEMSLLNFPFAVRCFKAWQVGRAVYDLFKFKAHIETFTFLFMLLSHFILFFFFIACQIERTQSL